ncbi:DUF998 domain-containing protein [Jongsikchunia kroppenstedtii]|uniref:DUF998 domain-containing protein n=1 Tax=Jongsikchunia kroppenstedtii TaxID=1121721 RepID=UPI000371F7C1|nr:DUF998 domain-containing protein [Jongsikchunia kroppenstedtii]
MEEEPNTTVSAAALVAAGVGPIGLLAAVAVAGLVLRPDNGYDPARDTVSTLASFSQTDLIITIGFGLSAAGLIATGLTFPDISRLSRTLLIGAGGCGLVIAAIPITTVSTVHLGAAAAGAILLAAWPVSAASRQDRSPLMFRFRTNVGASVMLAGLLGWVVFEAAGGALLGVAERVAIFAEISWPFFIVMSLWLSQRRQTPPIASAAKDVAGPPQITGSSRS